MFYWIPDTAEVMEETEDPAAEEPAKKMRKKKGKLAW